MGFIASGSVLLAGMVWGLRLIIDPGPFDEGSAALLATSIVIASATTTLGLVLARGQWARRLGLGILGAELLLAIAMDVGVWGGLTLLATSLSITLLAGPWLDGFLRRLPPAEPLPVPAMTLALGLLFVPAVLGVSAPGGVGALHWLAGLAALMTAWAFSRALPAGLWSARLLVPVLLAAAGAFTTAPGMIGVLAAAGAVGVLAWLPASAHAVRPLIAAAGGVAVPPELVPPDLLARAGYDDRGRPIRRRR